MSTLPSVSVVVLNYNGQRHLEDCFTSLQALDYPAEKLELVLCDNGSDDGSVAFMRRRFPGVRIIQLEGNHGFAGGNNLAAAAVESDWVAFVNNDMHLEPTWLSALAQAHQDRPEAVCFSTKILSWDGATIDFVGSGINFQGFGFQVDHGKRSSTYDVARRLFSPCGGAMMIRRDIFQQLGGFDDDYFANYEDTDLGWRLNLLGYEIWFVPDAIAYHRHHGSFDRIRSHRVRVLYERNSLYTIYKCLDDENLAVALPAAIMLLNEKALGMAGVNVDDFLLAAPGRRRKHERARPARPLYAFDPGAQALEPLSARARRVLREEGAGAAARKGARLARSRIGGGVQRVQSSVLKRAGVMLPYEAAACYAALSDFAHNLDRMQAKRIDLQARRVRSDAELIPMFQFALEPSYHEERYVGFHNWLCGVLGLDRRFGPGHLNVG